MRDFVRHIHFVGIGGIGMSGIAEVLLNLQFTVTGSDVRDSPIIQRLRAVGARIFIGHASENVGEAEVLVYSSAVATDNCELVAARAGHTILVPRAEMLGELMRFRKGIAVAGTHGKTTTTSLVAAVLTAANQDPTFIVGGVVNSAHSNARLGTGQYLVAEADESDASFLHLQPQLAVVTNIDHDHLENYANDFQQLQQAYLDFLHNLPFYGLAVLCFDDPHVRALASQLRRPYVSYGVAAEAANADYQAVHIRQQGHHSLFEVLRYGHSLGEVRLAMPGEHNVQNALAAIAIGYQLQLPHADIVRALVDFQGIGRRFQQFGRVKIGAHWVDLVDDYAHHPVELQATITAAQNCWPQRPLRVVFQPHRYSRTRDLFDDFVQILSTLHEPVITEVYAAGETAAAGSDGRALCRAIRQLGGAPVFVESIDLLADVLARLARPDDVWLTLGAGDIGRFAQTLAADPAAP